MENGHVQIHDPFSNHRDLSSNTDCDPKATSDTDSMEGSLELKLLRAYAKRRRPEKDLKPTTPDNQIVLNGGTHADEPPSPPTPAKTEKERKKKKMKGWKSMKRLFRCIQPQMDEDEPKSISDEPVSDRCGFRAAPASRDDREEDEEEGQLDKVARHLTDIADEIPFTPPDVESDGPPNDADVEKMIGLLLRDAGDRLNEQELKKLDIIFERFWDYGVFRMLISALLRRMGLVTSEPDAPGPQASPKTQMAVTCEVTSRLSAVNTHAMSRMLDNGARYLQDHFSAWATQQGGYEEAFQDDDDDDEVQ